MYYLCGDRISAVAEAMADEGRNGRAVECGGLENRCSATAEPGVRIPLSPPESSSQTRSFAAGFLFYMNPEPCPA